MEDEEPWRSETWWKREKPLTRLLRMYLEEQYKDTCVIVFSKVGNFYEVYGPNVEIVEHLLKQKKSVKLTQLLGLPINGVPYTTFPEARATLISYGLRVKVIDPHSTELRRRRTITS